MISTELIGRTVFVVPECFKESLHFFSRPGFGQDYFAVFRSHVHHVHDCVLFAVDNDVEETFLDLLIECRVYVSRRYFSIG